MNDALTDAGVAPSPQRVAAGRWLTRLSTVLIVVATLSPVTIVPTGEIGLDHYCIVCGSFGGVDVVLNVLMFVPLGAGLAFAGVRGTRAIPAMVAGAIVIECLQFLVVPGRDATLGDVLMNAAGGALGFGLGAHFDHLLTPRAAVARKLALAWCILWLGVQLLTAYSLLPVPPDPDARYFGQIAPKLAGMSAFTGNVLGAAVENTPIPDGEFAEQLTRRMHIALRQGALVQAQVTSFVYPPLIAPIVRIADDHQREILILAQREADFIFGVRTGADVLKLRPQRFLLRGVFPPRARLSSVGYTILLRGRYGRSAIFIAGGPEGVNREASVAPRLSQGWRLVMPVQTYSDGGTLEALLSALWIGGFLLPLGHWCAVVCFTRDPRHNRQMVAAVVGSFFVLLLIGLSGIPSAFGLPPAGALDWAAALTGAAAGAMIAAARRQRVSFRDGA